MWVNRTRSLSDKVTAKPGGAPALYDGVPNIEDSGGSRVQISPGPLFFKEKYRRVNLLKIYRLPNV